MNQPMSDDGFTDARANPEKTRAELAALFSEEAKANTPVITEPENDIVELPGGLVKGGEVIRTVRVRELTGEHEEALAKAARPPFKWAHFLSVLLECGTARIGDHPESATAGLLKDMLAGDRDAIVLGIRRVTYGDIIEVKRWVCPVCADPSDLSFAISDIDTVRLTDPREETTFTVPLRKGGHATVRLATGRDQLAVFENPELTTAEHDSILLSRCVTAITDATGMEMVTAGLGSSIALRLSIPDRKAILRALAERQPGPRYNEIGFTHQPCGKEVSLAIGLGDLFPDL